MKGNVLCSSHLLCHCLRVTALVILVELPDTDGLVISNLCASTVRKLVRCFQSIVDLKLVLNVGREQFDPQHLTALLRASSPRITTLSAWMRVCDVVIDGVPVTRLETVWTAVDQMSSLRSLMLEVQQACIPSSRAVPERPGLVFQVELSQLAQLEVFEFGSGDNSTSVYPSVVVAQDSARLSDLRLGIPLSVHQFGVGPGLLDPHKISSKLTQIHLLVTSSTDIAIGGIYPNLRSLSLTALIDIQLCILSVIDANTANLTELTIMSQSGHTDAFARLTTASSIPSLNYLMVGYFSCLTAPLNLAPVATKFPAL